MDSPGPASLAHFSRACLIWPEPWPSGSSKSVVGFGEGEKSFGSDPYPFAGASAYLNTFCRFCRKIFPSRPPFPSPVHSRRICRACPQTPFAVFREHFRQPFISGPAARDFHRYRSLTRLRDDSLHQSKIPKCLSSLLRFTAMSGSATGQSGNPFTVTWLDGPSAGWRTGT